MVGQVMTLTRLRTADAPRRDIVRLDTLVGEVIDDARFEHPDAQLNYVAHDARSRCAATQAD